MTDKQFTFPYQVFSKEQELPTELKACYTQAVEASSKAYAPYSGFSVGASALLSDGTIATGSNQENAAFPSGLCAERVLLNYIGHQYANESVVTLAICATKKTIITSAPVSPCGACRQVMLEMVMRQKKSFGILMIGADEIVYIKDVRLLTPFQFSEEMLESPQ